MNEFTSGWQALDRRNSFKRTLTYWRVMPIISAKVCWLILGIRPSLSSFAIVSRVCISRFAPG